MRASLWSKHGASLVGALSFVAFLAIVELLIDVGIINRLVVPPPSEILLSFERVILEENILGRFVQTAAECLGAGLLLSVLGISIGAAMHRYNLFRKACETWVAAWASAPIIMLYPLFLVVFGRTSWTVIAVALVAALPPVVLKTLEGLSSTRIVLTQVAKSFNMTASQTFWKILLPAAMPTIFVGLRLGLMFVLIVVLSVEYLINFGGLGQLINELSERYDLPAMYATICFVVLVSVLIFYSLRRLEQWATPSH